jgi:23S rRNA pseudouridine955/2504/2580 synthase
VGLIKSAVRHYQISDQESEQRIDNFLINKLKGLPKSRIYRLLRKGEVRVNKKRIDAFYRLIKGDVVRLPPVYLQEKAKLAPISVSSKDLLAERILYEDDQILILNKPSGWSVHAGSTVRIGVIEALRQIYPARARASA